MPTSFGDALSARFAKYGQICIGVDPHASILQEWGLDDSVRGLERFSFEVLDACTERVGLIKPQIAFFERFGSAGFAVLERLAARAKQTDLLVIMDAKRGDIGSTMAGYAQAWLAEQAPYTCDALTVSPYLGFQSLVETLSLCSEQQKGLFVLAATSNPEGAKLQQASIGSQTIAADVLRNLNDANLTQLSPRGTLGPFGAVIGATVDLTSYGLLSTLQADNYVTPILAPGFGFQGASLTEVKALFGRASSAVIASVSRSVLAAGSSGIRDSIENSKKQLSIGLSAGAE